MSLSMVKPAWQPAVTAAALALMLLITDWTAPLDARFRDGLLQLRSPAQQSDVCIVGIDEASLQALGPRPWPHRVHAAAIERLKQVDVAVIGYAVDFSHPDADPVGDALLARAMRQQGRVVLASSNTSSSGTIPELSRAAYAVAPLTTSGSWLVPGDSVSPFVRALLAADAPDSATSAFTTGLRHTASSLPEERFRCGTFMQLLQPGNDDWLGRPRWVLVGDVAAPGQSATAIEHQAAELVALRQGRIAVDLPLPLRYTLCALMAALLCLWPPPCRSLAKVAPFAALALAIPLLASVLLMLAGHWLPPFPIAFATALVWPLHMLTRRIGTRHIDIATGLPNTLAFRRHLQDQASGGRSCSLLLLKFDEQRALSGTMEQEVADLLRAKGRRPTDLPARLSTHRFALLLPDTDVTAATGLQYDLRTELAPLLVDHALHCALDVFTSPAAVAYTELMVAAGLAPATSSDQVASDS